MKLLFIFILISGSCIAQHSGYFGKKNYVEFTAIGTVPLIDNLFSYDSEVLKAQGSQLIAGKDWFESGVRLAIGHSISNRFGIGIEAGVDFQNIGAPLLGYGFENSADFITEHEMLDLRTIVVMPKVEFTNADGLLPIGLTHQIGIGYTSTKVVDRKYVLKRNGTIGATSTLDLAPIEDGFTGMVFFYGLSMRTPINKRLMLNYGIRYTGNAVFAITESSGILSGYQISRKQLGQRIRDRRFHNVLSFNFGFSVPF